MSKYIIEIEDVPFSKVRFDDNGAQNINLYRAKGFGALVFNEDDLDKLIPLDRTLDEAYQKGYDKGYTDKTNFNEVSRKLAKDVYQRGLEDGRNETWEAVRKIIASSGVNKPLDEMFGMHGVFDIINKFSASETIEKIKIYEKQQKIDSEIKVGDEVKWNGNKYIVTYLNKSINTGVVQDYDVMSDDGSVVENVSKSAFTKTGRYFPQVVELIKALRGNME